MPTDTYNSECNFQMKQLIAVNYIYICINIYFMYSGPKIPVYLLSLSGLDLHKIGTNCGKDLKK